MSKRIQAHRRCLGGSSEDRTKHHEISAFIFRQTNFIHSVTGHRNQFHQVAKLTWCDGATRQMNALRAARQRNIGTAIHQDWNLRHCHRSSSQIQKCFCTEILFTNLNVIRRDGMNAV